MIESQEFETQFQSVSQELQFLLEELDFEPDLASDEHGIIILPHTKEVSDGKKSDDTKMQQNSMQQLDLDRELGQGKTVD